MGSDNRKKSTLGFVLPLNSRRYCDDALGSLSLGPLKNRKIVKISEIDTTTNESQIMNHRLMANTISQTCLFIASLGPSLGLIFFLHDLNCKTLHDTSDKPS